MSDNPRAKFVRLTNGDDLIAEVVEIEDENGILYGIYNPIKVMYIPSEREGYLAIAFTPWVYPRICDQQEFVLHAEDVLIVCDASEGMDSYYWENIDKHMNNDKGGKDVNPETGMTSDEETELYNRLLEGLATKRTLH